MKRNLYAFALLCSLALPCSLFANHLPGGSITYTCLGGSQYAITLQLFRDCSGAAMIPQDLIFHSDCGTSFTLSALPVPAAVEVSQLCPDQLMNSTCNGGALPGMQVYNYTTTAPLDGCNSWTISWSLCCRATSLDLVGNAGIYIEARVNTSLAPCDNSPQFADNSVPYVCVGQPVHYNFGVSDPDGDSLAYSLIAARSAQLTNVSYQGTFTSSEPALGITLNGATGETSFTPPNIGYIVVVLRANSYNSNGVLIGSVMRDIPFIVYNCANNAPDTASGTISNVTGDASAIDARSAAVCAGGSLCFDVTISDADATQSLTLVSNVSTVLPGAVFDVMGTNPVIAHICWDSGTTTPGDNVFTITATDNACPNTASQIYTCHVAVSAITTASADTAICPGGSAQLSVSGGSSFTWSPTDGIIDPHAQQIVVSPALTTAYTVTTELPTPCNSDEVLVTVLDTSDPLCISTAIVPIKLNDQVRLFPNPSSGTLMLELDPSQAREVHSVEILDAMGRVRASIAPIAIGGTIRLDLPASLANGTYALRILTNGGSRTGFFDLLR